MASLRALAIAVILALTGIISLPAAAAAATSNDLDAVLDQSRKANSSDDFLPPEKAFRLSASSDHDKVRLDWVIAPGYYLYRDRIKIADDSNQIDAPQFPEGQVKQDE